MRSEDGHLSDAQLVAIADGEVVGREARRLEEHLTACWQCRSRRAELERTIAHYVRVHRNTSEKMPPMDESRARLLARLVQQSAAAPAASVSSRRLGRVAYGTVAACLILGAGLVLYFSELRAGATPVPDGQLTPGATRIVTKEDLCSVEAFDGFYPIPARVAFNVFESYQIQNPRPRSYEVDYLITPALGGAEDIRNLWPQPYASGEWNAHVKDALESHLHDLVCRDQLDLKVAQRDIASDWIAAYRKYFNTKSPLPDHVAFSVDPPWEN
jgi:hypothetical protein